VLFGKAVDPGALGGSSFLAIEKETFGHGGVALGADAMGGGSGVGCARVIGKRVGHGGQARGSRKAKGG